MKIFGSLVLAMLLFSSAGWGQFRNGMNQGPYRGPSRSNSDDDILNKIYFGGGGGFGFGTGYNYYSLYPIIGYRVTNDFSVGTGFNYQRYNYSATYYPLNGGSYSQYGLTPFLRYNMNPVFFQTEMDFISIPTYNSAGEPVRVVKNRFLIGLGYSWKVGRRGAFNLLAMYDLLYTASEQGIFGSPIVVRAFVIF